MIIHVDLENGASIREPEELEAFHATSTTTDDTVVGSAMAEAGHAAGDQHIWVSIDWIRRQVGGVVPASWNAGFDAMVAYAASKGWLDPERSHIKAHLELS